MSCINLVDVFRDTVRTYQNDRELADGILSSTGSQMIVLGSDDVPKAVPRFPEDAVVEVSRRRTFEAASRMEGRTCVLNFADAYTPGGCVKEGSRAQEECLCRCSTLYPCITDEAVMKAFYEPHKASSRQAFRDMIYTPDVIVFKDDDSYDPLGNRFKVDVVTCAAPNLNWRDMTDEKLRTFHRQAAVRMMTLASNQGCDNMVLGAFGCGCFKNDPAVVSEAIASVLPKFLRCFRRIEFAVYYEFDDENHAEFKRAMRQFCR